MSILFLYFFLQKNSCHSVRFVVYYSASVKVLYFSQAEVSELADEQD